jgi:hypothetical protein
MRIEDIWHCHIDGRIELIDLLHLPCNKLESNLLAPHCNPTPFAYIKEGRDPAIGIHLIIIHPVYNIARRNSPYNRAYEYKKSNTPG